MVLPVTGPFNKAFELHGPIRVSTGYSPLNFYQSRTWRRQKPPYTLPLPYSLVQAKLIEEKFFDETRPDDDSSYFELFTHTNFEDGSEWAIASEKAYDKLKSRFGEASQWANNALEARKSFDTAVLRVKQLVQFARKINRFDFVGAARVLKMGVPKGASRKKTIAGNWLEYHFGWEPLLKDIYAGMESLTRDFSPIRVKGSGRSRKKVRYFYPGPGAGDYRKIVIDYSHAVTQACSVRIVNPNASLLNDLGLANPIAVVWESIPFSFVVDWFSNVGAVVSSATDFLGANIESAYRSSLIKTVTTEDQLVTVPGGGGKKAGAHGVFEGLLSLRGDGLVGPSLRLKPFKGFSTTRGATAIALLIQLLPKH
jgi:hypothetical protein